MKAGIVTFERAVNYGTALQAAALRKALLDCGVEASFVDHACAEVDASSKVFDWKQIKSPAYTLAHLYNLPHAIKRKKKFQAFWDKYYHIGSANPADYDVLVAGSDQIWNYNLSGKDWFYLLDFPKGNVRKTAYAASFGLSKLDPKMAAEMKPLLEDFDKISVRERTAAGLVQEMIGQEVPVVLDPTLLLNKAQWSEMADPSFEDKGYIFVYTIFNSDTLWEQAYKLSAQTGLPIRTVSYSKIHKKKAIYTLDGGPSQWLSHMLHADYVLTNSFHGFAFSVNFEKQFYYELPPHSSGVGSRLADMAQDYGLTSRELPIRDNSVLDHAPVQEKLARAREASMAFLQACIQE